MSGAWVVWQVVVGAVLILSLLVLAIGLMLERAWRRRAEERFSWTVVATRIAERLERCLRASPR